jgi:hypothetical protein
MLTQDMINCPYVRGGQYVFHCGFDKDNGKTIYAPKLCPQITVQSTDIVQTTNATAQVYLAQAHIPQGMSFNGVRPPNSPIWLDVTNTHPVANVDLDPYFQ